METKQFLYEQFLRWLEYAAMWGGEYLDREAMASALRYWSAYKEVE